MYRFFSLIAVVALFVGHAPAQPPPPPDGAPPADAPGAPTGKKKIENKAGKKKDADDKAAASAGSTSDIVPLPGDTVYLKKANPLRGVKVIRDTPSGVEVQVTETDTLMIPRKQIDHIEYQAIDEAAKPAPGPESGTSVILGQKVSPELFSKLTAPIPDEFLAIKDADYTKVLADLGNALGVNIEIADAVTKLPAKERKWNATLEKGTKLSNLLQDELLPKFPALQLDFPEDKVVVGLKAAAPAEAAAPAPKS